MDVYKSNNLFWISISLILLLISASSLAEEDASYFCVTEDSTGFKYLNGEWKRVDFTVSDNKFVIRKLTEEEKKYDILASEDHTHGVVMLGEKCLDELQRYRPANYSLQATRAVFAFFDQIPSVLRVARIWIPGQRGWGQQYTLHREGALLKYLTKSN